MANRDRESSTGNSTAPGSSGVAGGGHSKSRVARPRRLVQVLEKVAARSYINSLCQEPGLLLLTLQVRALRFCRNLSAPSPHRRVHAIDIFMQRVILLPMDVLAANVARTGDGRWAQAAARQRMVASRCVQPMIGSSSLSGVDGLFFSCTRPVHGQASEPSRQPG